MIHKIYVANIKCGGCAHSITKKLEAISTISDIDVDHETGSVAFVGSDVAIKEVVKETLAKMGYPEGEPTKLQTAKSYISCAIGKVGKNL